MNCKAYLGPQKYLIYQGLLTHLSMSNCLRQSSENRIECLHIYNNFRIPQHSETQLHMNFGSLSVLKRKFITFYQVAISHA